MDKFSDVSRRSVLAGLTTSAAILPVMGANAAAIRQTRIGLYSGFFRTPSAQTERTNESDAKLLAKYGFNHFNFVELDFDQNDASKAFFSMLQSNGIACGMRPKWPEKGRDRWKNGDAAKALMKLRPIDALAYDYYLGHEVFEWADKKLRQQIVTSVRSALPTIKTRMYFADLNQPIRKEGSPHPHGGEWSDFALGGPVEPDIIQFKTANIKRGAEAILSAFDAQVTILKRAVPSAKYLYCHVNFAPNALTADVVRSTVAPVVKGLRSRNCDVVLFRPIDDQAQKTRPQEQALALLSEGFN